MKKSYSFLFMILLYFSTIGICNAANVLQMETFSIDIPDKWIMEKESENNVTFMMPEAKNEEIYISISAHPTSSHLSLDEAWNKMKPYMVKGIKVIHDDQDVFSDITWKKLEIQEIVGGMEMNKTVLFSRKNSTNYLIQFNCPKDECEKIMPLFNSVKKSLKFK